MASLSSSSFVCLQCRHRQVSLELGSTAHHFDLTLSYTKPSRYFGIMAEPTRSAVALHHATLVQTGDRESNAATATELLHQAITPLVDFVYPTSIRSEYRLILSKLSKNRFTCILLSVLLIVSVAEYEQPGWFPRPDQLSSAVVRTSAKLFTDLFNTAH